MRYIVAGYAFVLTVLFLYAVSLAWRRRRLTRAVARVTAGPSAAAVPTVAAPSDAVPTVAAPSDAVPTGGDR